MQNLSQKWIDMSPVVYTKWNRHFFNRSYPHHMTVETYTAPNGKKSYLEEGVGISFTESPNKEHFLHYGNLRSVTTSVLHPHRETNSTQCTAMVLHLVKEPVWVQVPCNKPILRDWVCKKAIYPPKDKYMPLVLRDTTYNIHSMHNSTCQSGQFKCHNGECILDVHICDGMSDCTTGEDEGSCNVCHDQYSHQLNVRYCRFNCGLSDTCTCNFLYHKKISSGYLPYINAPNINTEFYQCQDGKNIFKDYVDDLIPDCTTLEDEIQYIGLLSDENDNKVNVCPKNSLPCVSGHNAACYNVNKTCKYDLDSNGRLMVCTNGAHLQNCEDANCTYTYKCPHSYCIPHRHVCDGKHDCVNGDDEEHCQNYTCYNMLRCKNTTMCVHPVEVCDNVIHCPLADDELLCQLNNCPFGCKCIGYAMQCHNANYTYIPRLSPHVQSIIMSGNNIKLNDKTFSQIIQLKILVLFMNNIEEICIIQNNIHHGNIFTNLPKLLYMDLGSNAISTISSFCFHNLIALTELHLQNNSINTLEENAFMKLERLQKLNLSMNEIDYLAEKVFVGLRILKVLDLSGNRIQYIDGSLPDNFPVIHKLISSHFHLCCIVTSIELCVAPKTLFSCSSLLEDIGIKVWIYFLSITIIILNTGVIIIHHLSKTKNVHSFLIQLLALSDMSLGIYFFIIIVSDIVHGDQYALHDLEWRANVTCHIAAILSSLSFIMASVTVTLLAVVRHIGITTESRKPFWMKRKIFFSLYGAVFILLSLILVSVMLAEGRYFMVNCYRPMICVLC